MKCPTKDKLEKWFDGFDQVDEIIRSHVETCQECQQVIKIYAEEQELIKETLTTPILPDDFTIKSLINLSHMNIRRKNGNGFCPSSYSCTCRGINNHFKS